MKTKREPIQFYTTSTKKKQFREAAKADGKTLSKWIVEKLETFTPCKGSK